MNSRNELTNYNRDRWNLFTDLDRLFDDWAPVRRSFAELSQVMPPSDIEESENYYLITVELPGVKKDEIRIETLDNQITISGERKSETSEKEKSNRVFSERRYGRFERSFSVPTSIDVDKIEANYQDGVLKIMAPKAESSRPRQIKIGESGAGSKFFGKILGSDRNHKREESKDEKAAS
jgi:HSP20 family protein